MGLFGWAGELLGSKKAVDYYEYGLKSKDAGDLQRAEENWLKAVELAEEKKDYDTLGQASYELGEVSISQGNKVRAEQYFSKAMQVFDDSDDYANLVKSLIALGNVHMQLHKLADAERCFKYVITINQREHGAEHPSVGEACDLLAECFMQKKSYEEAEAVARRSLNIFEQTTAAGGAEIANSLCKLAMCLAHQSKDSEAEKTYQKAIDALEQRRNDLTKAEAMTLCHCYHELGRLYMRQSKSDLAATTLKKALVVCDEYPGYLGEGDLVTDHARCSGSSA